MHYIPRALKRGYKALLKKYDLNKDNEGWMMLYELRTGTNVKEARRPRGQTS